MGMKVSTYMMMRKKDLGKLVAEVLEDRLFFGPVRIDNDLILTEVKPDDELNLDYANFKLPPKRQFLPQSESFLTYNGDSAEEVTISSKGVVFFGIRPCDAHSLHHLDCVFLEEPFVDPYYLQRREKAVIISLACSDPRETCFCTAVGGGPASKIESDVLAFDMGDAILLESCSQSGTEFIKRHGGLLSAPSKNEIETRTKIIAKSEAAIRRLDLSRVPERLEGLFDSPLWEEVTQRCLGCGVCTYSCPTCHCFSLHDERTATGGRRIRVQDTCIFPQFTLEASGHNPRTESARRMRQRIMHKMKYAPERHDEIFCVGCGRCILDCPVNIDIRETFAEVMK